MKSNYPDSISQHFLVHCYSILIILVTYLASPLTLFSQDSSLQDSWLILEDIVYGETLSPIETAKMIESFEKKIQQLSSHKEKDEYGLGLEDMKAWFTATRLQDKKEAIRVNEKAYKLSQEYIEVFPKSIEGYIYKARIMSRFIDLKGVFWIITNGKKLQRAIDMAWDLDSENIDIILLKYSKDIFAPKAPGSDLEEGLQQVSLLESRISEMSNKQKFYFYFMMQSAYSSLKEPSEASRYASKMIAIYPMNSNSLNWNSQQG